MSVREQGEKRGDLWWTEAAYAPSQAQPLPGFQRSSVAGVSLLAVPGDTDASCNVHVLMGEKG